MPIKFPKFTRRKSSGNALEAAYEPADQGPNSKEEDGRDSLGSSYGGFKVYPRANRGSGNTESSAQSSADYYAGSSNRLSSSSTLPSADAPRTPDDYRPHMQDGGQSGLYPYGYTKPGNTPFTGTNSALSGSRSPGSQHTGATPSRRGTMSTATPPKLETSLDTSSLFGGDDMFDFGGAKKSRNGGNSQGIGSITPTAPKIASSIINTGSDISPVPPPKSYDPTISPTASRFTSNTASTYSNIFTNSQHLDSDRPPVESSPYHWDSKPTDDLLTSPMNCSPRNSRMLTPGQKSTTFSHSRTDSLEAPSSRHSKSRGSSGDSAGLKRASAVMRRSSYDEDAAIVAGSVHKPNGHEPQGPRPQPGLSSSAPVLDTVKRLSDRAKDRDSGWEETLPSISSSDNSLRSSGSSRETTFTSPMMSRGNTDLNFQRPGIDSNHSTPKAKKTALVETSYSDVPDVDDDFDVSMSQAAALAAKYEDSSPGPQIPVNKVMTRAQFERYQQQQDDQRRLSGKAVEDEDDDDSVVSDEEESEVEQNRQAAKLRERQDAHLSVYRQQMMKISGTDQQDTALGMHSRMASMSTSALPLTHTALKSGPGSSDGEDEEIPLGILLAHGFPGKNRPPTRLSNASSQPNLRGAAQIQQDPRLPPFARHLPQDPYNIGAGLVNPMDRMSLAFSAGGDTRSVAGGSVYGGIPPSQLPGRGPGGLVGEIVKAEEQKAARKGMGMQFQPQQSDPFKQDPFARSGSPGGGMLGMGAGNNSLPVGINQGMMNNAMGMGVGVGMSGGQMNQGIGMNASDSMQQMQQMMQMQMQFMHMQMQMNQQQPQQMLQPQPQFMTPIMGQQQRPTSVMSMNPQMGGLGVPQAHPRAMSMIDHQFPQIQPVSRASYTPSIAPSHRGPIGGGFLGPGAGYTPSIAPSERSNIGLPQRYRPVSHQPGSIGARTATLTSGAGQDWNGKAHGPSHLKNTNVESDEDDESGWEELNRKRKEKKEKKKNDGLKGMLHFSTASNPSTT